MKDIKYLYREAFAVIGKAGEGPAGDSQKWIPPLWDDANAHFAQIAEVVRRDENGAPLIWGAMNDETESNKRWGDVGKYMAGCEADIDAQAPKGWTKWIIPAQTYCIITCTMDEYGEAFGRITNDPAIKIVGTVHERYPQPGNSNMVALYFPIAAGRLSCHACAMPMTIPADFGTEEDGRPNAVYCRHCYENGTLRPTATLDVVTCDVQSLANIEAAHPNLLSTPLLKYIQAWLSYDEVKKMESIPALHAVLVDAQDCDFTGTRWEREWLADGKVCHCIACVAARKCISDIRAYLDMPVSPRNLP